MKIFISWSGPLSHQCALILSTWLPSVIQSIEPFLSSEDIEKGAKWFDEINSNLSDAALGIVCLTADNLNKPWLLFEAGALSKALGKPRVCPLLINIRESDLKGPLAQFQCTLPSKDDMLKLIKTTNTQLKDDGLKESQLLSAFNRWWLDFEKGLAEAIKEQTKTQPTPPKRDQHDLLVEILEICRAVQRNITPSTGMPSVSAIMDASVGSGKTYDLGDFYRLAQAGERIKKGLSVSQIMGLPDEDAEKKETK